MDDTVIQEAPSNIRFGCDSFGRLTTVMMHSPGQALSLINRYNHSQWLFDNVPSVGGFVKEHNRYRQLLESHNIKVLEVTDYIREHKDLVSRMPNLTYLHNTAVVSRRGAVLSAMAFKGREKEEIVVKEALSSLGIPILMEFDSPRDAFEGFMLLSDDTVLVTQGERHTYSAIKKFISRGFVDFKEIIYVRLPKKRRFRHVDTIYNRVDHNLALAYPPAFRHTFRITEKGMEKIDFMAHMADKGIDIIPVSDDEQRRLACNFLPVAPGVIFQYDTALNPETIQALNKKGVELVFFHPEALTAGGGGLQCLTLPLHREAQVA